MRSLETKTKTSVVVMDGITLGRRCCGVPNCKISLRTNHEHFCPDHSNYNTVCAITNCGRTIVEGTKTCDIPEHQRIEETHTERGKARFQLKERLRRSNLAHPNDSVGIDDLSATQLIDDDASEELYDLSQPDAPIPLTQDNTSNSKRIRAQFGGRRTHNEQIIVAPCGIIKARETFYNAEAPKTVIVSLEIISQLYSLMKY